MNKTHKMGKEATNSAQNDNAKQLTLQGERLILNGERAVIWLDAPRGTSGTPGASICRTLLLSDTHFGKAETFQEHGIPVPGGETDRDLQRLTRLTEANDIDRIIVLGDLFHSKRNSSWDRVFSAFGALSGLDLVLIMGNHDIIHQSDYESIGFRCFEELALGPFLLRHHPPENDYAVKTAGAELPDPGPSDPEKLYRICGHLHPSFRLHGAARQRLTLPCYWVRPDCLILPAFGSFTGTHPVTPGAGDSIWVVAGDSVLPAHIARGD